MQTGALFYKSMLLKGGEYENQLGLGQDIRE
jgi:hypothetical protein